jgi:hypothetical protein
MDQGGSQVEASAHAAGVGAHGPGGGGGELEALEQLVSPGRDGAARQVREAADQAQVLRAREVVVHRRVLPGQPDPGPDLVGVPGDVVTEHVGAPVVRGDDRGEYAHGGGLAGSVGPEQAEHCARRHPQVDAV